MTPQMMRLLEELASCECVADNVDNPGDEYDWESVSDAYLSGNRDGRIELARELLDEFGRH